MIRSLFAAVLVALDLPAGLAIPAAAQETRDYTDAAGRAVTIPADPQRIVALHASILAVPLIELGAIPVGSHGRGEMAQDAFVRASATVNGINFDNSEIAWIGNRPADVELTAALELDLIVTKQWQPTDVGQLRAIAPTVLLDYTMRSDYDRRCCTKPARDSHCRARDIAGRHVRARPYPLPHPELLQRRRRIA